MNSMKRQKDRTLKDELPRSVSAQYATGDWWRNNFRKNEGKRRRGQQRMRWLESLTDSMDMSLSKLWVLVKDRGVWHAIVRGAAKTGTHLSN